MEEVPPAPSALGEGPHSQFETPDRSARGVQSGAETRGDRKHVLRKTPWLDALGGGGGGVGSSCGCVAGAGSFLRGQGDSTGARAAGD